MQKRSKKTDRATQKERRLGHIVRALLSGDGVDATSLAERFAVDVRTARDDIVEITELAKMRPSRLRGGLRLAADTYHQVAQRQNVTAKSQIAAHAANYFDSSGSLAASPGTTVAMVYAMLIERGRIPAVVTNSLAIIAEPSSTTAANVTLVGGQFDRRINATIGTVAVEGLQRHRCRDGLLGVSGISAQGQLYVQHDAEVPVLEAMLASIEERLIIVADMSKIGRGDPWNVGNVNKLSEKLDVVLVTNDVDEWHGEFPRDNARRAKEGLDQLRDAQIKLELVPKVSRAN